MAKSRVKAPKVAVPPGSKRIFKWRGGGFNGVPAQVVGEELARLEVAPGQFHRTTDVLDAARDPESPLHGCFNWDDESAAEKHRLDQARNLLRSIAVVIVRDDSRQSRPVYVHVGDADGPRYVRAEQLATNEELQRRAVDEVLAQLNGIRRRYDFVSELAPVFEAIEQAAEKIKGGKKR